MTTQIPTNRSADASALMQQFVKCITNLKLYPPDHAHCQGALGNFSSRLQRYLRQHQLLRLTVSQSALTADGQPVYEAEARSDNLAFRLYVDGLREITIHSGTTAKEAERLALAVARVLADSSLDAVNLFWEADFEHVEYQALTALAEAWEQQDFLTDDSVELLESMNEDVEQLAAGLQEGSFNFELSDGAAEVQAATALRSAAIQDEDTASTLGAEALQAFRDEVLAWSPERLLTQTIAVALDGLAQEPELVAPESAGWLLQESVEMAIRSNDLESLAELLDRYHGELQLIEDEPAEELFEALFRWLRTEETAGRILALPVAGALGGPAAFFRIAAHYEGDMVRLLARAFVALINVPDWREAIAARLGPLLQGEPKVIEFLLGIDHEGVAVETLKLVGQHTRGKALEQAIRIARVHPLAAAQELGHQLWLSKTEEGQASLLGEELHSPERAKRLNALQALLQAPTRKGFDIVKEIVNQGDFLKRDADERRAFLSAARNLGGTAAVAFLQEQSKRTTRLFNRQAVKELREMATAELEQLRKATRSVGRPK